MSEVVLVPEVHEILMRQLPHWFKPVLEYIAIMQGWAVTLADEQNDAYRLKENFFVQTADADTLKQWERLMNISARPSDTLDFRRERILTRLMQTAPFTYWHLKERLTELFGDEFTLEVDAENCAIKILVTSGRYGAVDLLNDLIYNVIPAHLDVTSNQEVTTYIISNQYIACFLAEAIDRTIYTTGLAIPGDFNIGNAVQSVVWNTI